MIMQLSVDIGAFSTILDRKESSEALQLHQGFSQCSALNNDIIMTPFINKPEIVGPRWSTLVYHIKVVQSMAVHKTMTFNCQKLSRVHVMCSKINVAQWMSLRHECIIMDRECFNISIQITSLYLTKIIYWSLI